MESLDEVKELSWKRVAKAQYSGLQPQSDGGQEMSKAMFALQQAQAHWNEDLKGNLVREGALWSK